jgi:predicted protein tyrosine phosphatase
MLKTVKAVPYTRIRKWHEGLDDYDLLVLENTHDNVWIVSVTDCDIDPIFQNGERILTLQFEDVDPEWFARFNTDEVVDDFGGMSGMTGQEILGHLTFENPFTPEQAMETVDFILRAHASDGNDCLIVNCMAGVSRSGAIATMTQQICQINYDSFKRMNPQIIPNAHVMRLMTDYYSTKVQ